jgi:hypothetical protein
MQGMQHKTEPLDIYCITKLPNSNAPMNHIQIRKIFITIILTNTSLSFHLATFFYEEEAALVSPAV